MDKYLLEILKNVNTIIIPGLGALTITNHDTGEIMFMSYLKHDDGKLVSYIMENEGFEELEAKNLIAKYVREIELTIGKGDSYDMFQFGSFYKNGDDIDFKNWDKSGESTKEKKVAKKVDSKPTKAEVKKDVVKKDVVTKQAPTSKDGTQDKTKEDKVIVATPKKKEMPAAPEKKATPKSEQIKDDKKKELTILEKEEQEKHAKKLADLKKAKDEQDKKNKDKKSKDKGQKSKRGVGFWMLMTLIVLIFAGGTYFGLNYNELKQHIPFLADKEEVVDSSEQVDEHDNDTSSEDDGASDYDTELEENITQEQDGEEMVEDEVLPVEQIEQIPVAKEYSGTDLPFHVIAGAFSSEENARRLGDKLSSEGYSVKVGPGRGMTLVSIKSFSTRAEAQQGLNELIGVAPKGWIYEWK